MAVSSKKKKKSTKKKKYFLKEHYKMILITSIIVAISSISIYLIIPKIRLKGNTYETISYKDTYKESGYKATMLFKNINKLVKVDNKLTNTKVGTYDITYNLNYKFLTIRKKRTVNT